VPRDVKEGEGGDKGGWMHGALDASKVSVSDYYIHTYIRDPAVGWQQDWVRQQIRSEDESTDEIHLRRKKDRRGKKRTKCTQEITRQSASHTQIGRARSLAFGWLKPIK
jgi:hypothetical protein